MTGQTSLSKQVKSINTVTSSFMVSTFMVSTVAVKSALPTGGRGRRGSDQTTPRSFEMEFGKEVVMVPFRRSVVRRSLGLDSYLFGIGNAEQQLFLPVDGSD